MNTFSSQKLYICILLILALSTLAILGVLFFNPYPLKYKQNIIEESQKYNISPAIIASIINAESSFNPNARSSQGALGLMQIMPTTASWICSMQNKEYSEDLLLTPETNIEIGTYYFNYLLKKFSHLETALSAYNAGEGNVLLWLLSQDYSPNGKTIENTPFKETNKYIKKVVDGIKIYTKKIKQ